MSEQRHLTRRDLADRWECSIRTIDRLRESGLLSWLDVSGGNGGKPLVRFALEDVEAFEARIRHREKTRAA